LTCSVDPRIKHLALHGSTFESTANTLDEALELFLTDHAALHEQVHEQMESINAVLSERIPELFPGARTHALLQMMATAILDEDDEDDDDDDFWPAIILTDSVRRKSPLIKSFDSQAAAWRYRTSTEERTPMPVPWLQLTPPRGLSAFLYWLIAS